MAVVLDATVDLTAAVDSVCAADPVQLAEGETIRALHRQLERLSAARGLGRALRSVSDVEAAWLAGDMGEAQVGLLAAARTSKAAECFARDERWLVEQAVRLRAALLAPAGRPGRRRR